RVFVPWTRLAPYSCKPTVTASKVSGWLPKTFEKRIRISSPQRSGLDDRTQSLCGCAAVAPVGEWEREVGLNVRRSKSCRRGRKRLVLHDRRGVDEEGGW